MFCLYKLSHISQNIDGTRLKLNDYLFLLNFIMKFLFIFTFLMSIFDDYSRIQSSLSKQIIPKRPLLVHLSIVKQKVRDVILKFSVIEKILVLKDVAFDFFIPKCLLGLIFQLLHMFIHVMNCSWTRIIGFSD